MAQLPQSEVGNDIAAKPESLAIKQALDHIVNSKKKKEEIIQGCVTNLANLNVIEQLMAVH